jgi:acyl transferase domain-containing protein
MAAATTGMARPFAASPAARAVFEEFSDHSGIDVFSLALDADEATLLGDRHWELATVATEAAALAALREQGGEVNGALGFSIGAYVALLCAGVTSVVQTVTMIDAVLDGCRSLAGGPFAMAAVSGVTAPEAAAAAEAAGAALAAVITPSQTLLAGPQAAVGRAVAGLATRALRIQTLDVRWPLHTAWMGPARERLTGVRASLGGFHEPARTVYSALHGRRLDGAEECWELLTGHLTAVQRFDVAFAAARADGFARCVELGPGGTLTRAVRWLARDEVTVSRFRIGDGEEYGC